MQQLQKLLFSISLLDKVTGPAGKITKALGNTAASAKSAFADIGIGALGITGAGMAMKSIVQPALDMQRALGSLASLGMADNDLKEFGRGAVKLSTELGVSASSLARSAYDLQSAMGLGGAELSEFTKVSGVLAKATLADSSTITKYMTTMYGVFNKSANEMGRTDWVQQMSGMTAEAVRMFRTSGTEMASAFGSLTSSATDFGVSMSEQMAILGTLQNVIPSGSEAATAYRSFLAGAQKAQGSLGVKLFADVEMKELLPIQEILDGVKGMGSMELQSAFGSQEAVKFLSILQNNVGSLSDGLTGIGNIKGMEKAFTMADKNIDPWEQLTASIEAVKIGFGSALLPVLNPLVGTMAEGASTLYRWADLFPEITKYIGIGVASIIGLTGVIAGLSIVSGIAKVAMIGWGMAATVTNGIVTALSGVMRIFRTVMLAVNIAMFANPIGLIIGGIAALVMAVGACIYWWDDLKAAFLDTAWGTGLMNLIGDLIGWFKNLQGIAGTAVGWVVDKLNMIPGINIEGSDPQVGTVNQSLKTAAVGAGGVTNHMQKTFNQGNTADNRRNVTINTTQSPTAGLFDSYFAMESF